MIILTIVLFIVFLVSFVIYIKDDSYLLFIQDSMTIQKTLAYNMYGIVIYTNYKPIIK